MLLFIAILYTIGVVINKFCDIRYDHNTYIDMFTSFFLIFIWLMALTQQYSILFSIIFSFIMGTLLSFIFGIFNKVIIKKNNTIENNENKIYNIDNTILNDSKQELENFNNQWVGLTGIIIKYDQVNNNYLGSLDNGNGSIILYTNEEEKLNTDDHFTITSIENARFYCTKQN